MPVRRLWAAALLVFILFGLACALLGIPDAEQALAIQKAKVSRVIVYELRPGGQIDFPVEPKARVYRLVAHAERAKALGLAPHDVELSVSVGGASATRTEKLTFAAPSTAERVEPEDHELFVGDPVAVDFEVRAQAGERLTIALRSIRDADALLVRVYDDEAVQGLGLVRRAQHVDLARSELLARRAGLPHWIDVPEAEQIELLGSRWRKLAPLRDARVAWVWRAIMLATRPVAAETSHETLLSTSELEPGKAESLIVHGANTIRCRAEGRKDVRVTATRRTDDGASAMLEGSGEIAVDVPPGKMEGVECSRSSAGPLSVRAAKPAGIERSERIAFWRASPARPVVVRAADDDLVLRLAARRPVRLSDTGSVPLALEVRIVDDAAPRRAPMVMTLEGTSAPSRFDRYERNHPREAPTDSVTFHVLIPHGHSAVLRPKESLLDLTLAELNVDGHPLAVRSYPAAGRPAPTAVLPAPARGEEREYIARRPSNWTEFGEGSRGFVRVARRVVTIPAPEPTVPSFRVRRPKSPQAIAVGGRTFEPATATFFVDVPKHRAVPLPVRVYAPESVQVTVQVDGGAPRRRRIGAPIHVTTSRTFAASREVRAFVILGDDLQPGKHSVAFKIPPGKKVWVHLPWVKDHRPPRPHWIESEFTR
jgi:hypothetical protein